MKKIFLIILCLFAMCLSACTSIENEVSSEKVSMFVIVETTRFWKVVYHRETKVMYAVSLGSYNKGTFTLLVDENGKPLLWEGR